MNDTVEAWPGLDFMAVPVLDMVRPPDSLSD